MFEILIDKFARGIAPEKDEEDIEVISYGLGIIISLGLLIIGIIFTSLFINRFFEAILYILSLLALRRRIGGIHSNSYERCMLLTYITCFIAIGINEVVFYFGSEIHSKLLLLIGSLLILEFAPMDTRNREFSDKEKELFRIKSLEILCCMILISYFLSLGFPRLSGMINIAVLAQGIAIINKRRLLEWKRKLQKE